MQNFDFSPLFRNAIGFDRLTHALETAHQANNSGGYPPYNIELTGEDKYCITMAIAGFTRDDLEIETKQNILRVSGSKSDSDEGRTFLHRGIANRSFDRSFQLADHVRVGNASFDDGLLHIDLYREIPEALKPRTITITDGRETVQTQKVAAA